jgi:Tfp pilus assembly protein PilF
VRHEAASLFTEAGLDAYRRDQLAAAEDAWRKACQAAPARADSMAGIAMLRARSDSQAAADLAQAEVAPLMARLADRPLRADILTALGHSYFGAGDFMQARKCFAQSLAAFSLPKRINYGAQKGLGGL